MGVADFKGKSKVFVRSYGFLGCVFSSDIPTRWPTSGPTPYDMYSGVNPGPKSRTK
jgi:hypothetical protein